MRARGIDQLNRHVSWMRAIEGGYAYSRWKRPGKSDTRRSPSRSTIVVSDVVLLVDGIYFGGGVQRHTRRQGYLVASKLQTGDFVILMYIQNSPMVFWM